MKYVAITLVVAFNCIILLFFSALAVGGDGSADGIFRVWIFGYSWIAVVSFFAFRQSARGHSSKALGIAASTLPVGYAAALIVMLVGSAFGKIKSDSPEFLAACKGAGPHYIAKPATTVKSIAYDWAPGTYPPDINYFKLDARGNVSNSQGGIPRFPLSIEFTEGRCCQFEGAPLNGVRPFIRRPNGGAYFGVTELTSDVLITYKTTYVEKAKSTARVEIVDISVSDRRDGQILATQRYALDMQDRRGCGATSNGAMDEQAFIRQAIGIN